MVGIPWTMNRSTLLSKEVGQYHILYLKGRHTFDEGFWSWKHHSKSWYYWLLYICLYVVRDADFLLVFVASQQSHEDKKIDLCGLCQKWFYALCNCPTCGRSFGWEHTINSKKNKIVCSLNSGTTSSQQPEFNALCSYIAIWDSILTMQWNRSHSRQRPHIKKEQNAVYM